MKITKRILQALALASSLYVLGGGRVSIEPASVDAAETAPATVALGIQIAGEPRAPSIEQHADSTEQHAVSTLIREAHSDGGYWYYR